MTSNYSQSKELRCGCTASSTNFNTQGRTLLTGKATTCIYTHLGAWLSHLATWSLERVHPYNDANS